MLCTCMYVVHSSLFFIRACHGPALVGRPITFSCSGPRPGPAHQIFIGWATARPGSSFFFQDRPLPGPARQILEAGPRPGPARQFFQRMGCGPARPIESKLHRPGPARPINLSNLSARLGPAHDIGSKAHEIRASNGPARGFEEPAHGSAHGLAHVLPRTKKCTLMFLIFSY